MSDTSEPFKTRSHSRNRRQETRETTIPRADVGLNSLSVRHMECNGPEGTHASTCLSPKATLNPSVETMLPWL